MTVLPRVDARDKVTGALRYGADRVPDQVAYAMLTPSAIGKGRVVSVDTAAAEAVAGVRLIITRIDPGELKSAGFLAADGYGFQSLQPLTGDRIAYRGQPIALVVADTLIAATEAAELITASYETEPFALTIDADGTETVAQAEAIPVPALADTVAGDADAAFAASPVQVDVTYDCPQQHQVPMELIASVVEWRGDTLVVHEGTQSAGAIQNGLARQLGIDAGQIEVISPYAGGAFGQKNSLQPHIGPLAIAARQLGRPVKLVMPRTQTFQQASFRPASRHRVRLGRGAPRPRCPPSTPPSVSSASSSAFRTAGRSTCPPRSPRRGSPSFPSRRPRSRPASRRTSWLAGCEPDWSRAADPHIPASPRSALSRTSPRSGSSRQPDGSGCRAWSPSPTAAGSPPLLPRPAR